MQDKIYKHATYNEHTTQSKSHVNIITYVAHVDIIMLYVDIHKSHVNLIMLHGNIIHLACRGQKQRRSETNIFFS